MTTRTEIGERTSEAPGKRPEAWNRIKDVWSLPLAIALICTFGWGWLVWSIAIEPTPVFFFFDGPTAWELFWQGRPNEMGDTLAGLTGVLVMIWVVASTFLQRAALKDQSRVADQQIAALKETQKAQAEHAANAVFEERLRGVKAMCAAEPRGWTIVDTQLGKRSPLPMSVFSHSNIPGDRRLDFAILNHSNSVTGFRKEIEDLADRGLILETPSTRAWYIEIHRMLQAIHDEYCNLGKDQQVRYKNLHLASMKADLAAICAMDDIWSKQDESK